MTWVIGGLLAIVLGGLLLVLIVQRRDQHLEKAAIATQAIATSFALLLAGYWYIYERKGQPHADVDLRVTGVKLDADRLLLEARLGVRNLGSTLLKVGESDFRLQSVAADALPLEAVTAAGYDEWPADIDGTRVYFDGVLQWPSLRWFKGGGAMIIEPGERDLRVVDFIVACEQRLARVTAALQNPGGNGLVWRDRALVSLVSLCDKPVGSKEVLSDESNT